MTRKDEPLLIDKLTDYYEEKKILSTNFCCPRFELCRQGMCLTPENARTEKEALNTFTQAKSALVGKHYEHTTPRLLFVSLDPRFGDPHHPLLRLATKSDSRSTPEPP